MNENERIEGFEELAIEELEQAAGGRWQLQSQHVDGLYVQTVESNGYSAMVSSTSKHRVGDLIRQYVPHGFSGSLSIHEKGLDFDFAGHRA
jgi:hypothetical protein